MFILQLFAEICTALEHKGRLIDHSVFFVPSHGVIFRYLNNILTVIDNGETHLWLSDCYPFAMHDTPLTPTIQSEVLLEIAELVNLIKYS